MTTRHRLLAARIAYVAIVLIATLTNLAFVADPSAAIARLQRAFTPALSWRDAVDGLRNAVLFAGLGGVWVLTSLSGKVRREVWLATLASFVLSTMVEGLQSFSPVRNASIVDVMTNTLGGLAGALAAALVLAALHGARRDRSYLGIPMMLIAGPYALAVLCEALAPLFSSDPLRYLEGGPWSRLMQTLAASTPLDSYAIPVWDIPLFVAAGFLLVALLRERRGASGGDWLAVSVVGAVVLAAAHVIHGATALPVRWEAVITDALSLAAGAWSANRWLGTLTQRYRGADRARGALFVYGGLLVLWGWRPLVPEFRWTAIVAQVNVVAFTPLAGLAQRVDAFSALHVAQQFLLYVPLGALLAVWPLRLHGRWAHLWPGLALAAVIELGHVVINGRTFDVTNLLLAIAALCLGWIAVRRCGYLPYGAAAPAAR